MSSLRWSILGFWLRGQNVVGLIGEIFSTPANVHFPLRHRMSGHPVCGKMETPHYFVPLEVAWNGRREYALFQEVQNSQNVALQEKFHWRIFKGARNISHSLYKQWYRISPVKGKIGYFGPPEPCCKREARPRRRQPRSSSPLRRADQRIILPCNLRLDGYDCPT